MTPPDPALAEAREIAQKMWDMDLDETTAAILPILRERDEFRMRAEIAEPRQYELGHDKEDLERERDEAKKHSDELGDEAEELRAERTIARAQRDAAENLLRRYEAWEGRIITDGEWESFGGDGLPRLTQPLYDEMLELQRERNAVLAAAAKREGKEE